MKMSRSDQDRISQLTAPYSPFEPPQLPLDFGDYLSLLWWAERGTGEEHLVHYYLDCAHALAKALDFHDKELGQMMRGVEAGRIYQSISNVPFRRTDRKEDAASRKAAIQQLLRLRADVMSIGAYEHDWVVGWPGSGILDEELRERVFATLFTALRGQFSHFGRLLLVIDIVLQELLLDTRTNMEFSLGALIDRYGYPDPEDPAVRTLFRGEG